MSLAIAITFKVGVKKDETISEIENSLTSTIFSHFIWKFVKITISWEHDVAGKPAWLDQNRGFYMIINFLECLIFFDSDFNSPHLVVLSSAK